MVLLNAMHLSVPNHVPNAKATPWVGFATQMWNTRLLIVKFFKNSIYGKQLLSI
jgi:hypothetical protein